MKQIKSILELDIGIKALFFSVKDVEIQVNFPQSDPPKESQKL
jgi:hypothetical protein